MKIIVIIGLLISHYACAVDEWHVAIINDPDGYVFVRSGQRKENPVIDTIPKNTFFYCYGDTSRFWIAVQNPVDGKTGFMHHSRIAFFHELDSAKQHELILSAFEEMIAFKHGYWTKVQNITNEKRMLLYKQNNELFEGKYVPAYTAFTQLFLLKPDSVLLVAFFKTLPSMRGSADEGKDWTSAKCWMTHTEFVNKIVCHWKNEEERQTIINSIKTGMAMSGFEDQFTPAGLKKKYGLLEKKCVN